MRAVLVTSTTGTSGIEVLDLPRPSPAQGEVLVEVAAVAPAFPDPDAFDYDRPPSASSALAFGLGTHHCAGQALARAEMRAVLDVLADRYDRIEVVGEPVWLFTPRHRNCEGLVVRLS